MVQLLKLEGGDAASALLGPAVAAAVVFALPALELAPLVRVVVRTAVGLGVIRGRRAAHGGKGDVDVSDVHSERCFRWLALGVARDLEDPHCTHCSADGESVKEVYYFVTVMGDCGGQVVQG